VQPRYQQPHLWLLPLAEGDGCPVSNAEQSWSQTLPPAVQARYRRSRSLLRRQLAGLLNLPVAAVPLHSPPGEAPTLGGRHGYVSLSHSVEHVLLAWSPWPIGVDLERQDRPIQADLLARRFFPEQEWQRLQLQDAARRSALVLESWVRKEAAIKWRRSSLASDLRHWYWNPEQQELLHLLEGWQPASHCERRHGWLCAVVGQAAEQGIWS